MTKLFYLDTSIWIDFYDKRERNGEIAKKFIRKIIKEDWIICYSDLVIVELKRLVFSDFEINEMFKVIKPNHIKHIHSSKDQLLRAKKISKQRNIPFGDVVHAILSKDNEAQLVSRDHDFEKVEDITKTKFPEALI